MALDQITKWWAFLMDVDLTLIPNFLHLDYVRNTGAAWSILEGYLPILAVISFVAGVLLLWYFYRNDRTLNGPQRWSLVLILSGTWGNFIDRAFYGEGVIDFVKLQFGNYYFPTFNVADSCLTIGVIALIAFAAYDDWKDRLWKKKSSK